MRRLVVPLAATAAALLALLAAMPDAHACSWPQQLTASLRYPADGAANVPTNTRLWVDYYGAGSLDGYALHLRPLGGDDVPLVSAGSRLGHGWDATEAFAIGEPLAPSTTYEILDNQILPCNAGPPCTTQDFHVRATFTTGTGPDLTPPAFQPTFDFVLGPHDVCDSDACCGPYDRQVYGISWTEAVDDAPVIYDVDGRWLQSPDVSGAIHCAGPYDGGALNEPTLSGGGSVTVRAVDMAGNVTDGHQSPDYEVSCPSESALGCQVAAGGRTRHLAALAVLAVLAALTARRRSRSSP